MTKDTGKREDAIKERFVGYLRRHGLDWITKAQDVPTKKGRKNFDYLLQCNDQTLALEITTRNDEQESLAHNSKSLTVWHVVYQLILPENLGGCTWFTTPSSYSRSLTKLKNLIKHHGPEIAMLIEVTSNALAVDEEKALQTKLGLFIVGRVEGPPGILPYVTCRCWDWKLAEAWYQESLVLLDGMMRNKNDQLDCNANRRILLISDNAPFGKPQFRDAVLKCFGQTRYHMKNIDEVFIEFCENDFERVYAR